MAASRGLKFSFSEGERVLCFEPDPTKAKVLYDAKILETNVGKDENGKRIPEYLVHFSGWNSSWDRIVGEDHILKCTPQNMKLKRKLAAVARATKKNKNRRNKIDDLLKQVYDKHELGSEGSGDENSEQEESNQEDSGDSDRAGSSEEEESSSDLEEMEESEEEETDEVKEVIIEIPDMLKKKLEDDCYYINRKKKLVNVPAEPNVVTILEGFVKNYAVNILCGTVEKQRSSYSAEHRIQLCKEVMDGLRIFFDFLLPLNLLYNAEKAQYKNVASYKPVSACIAESESIPQSPVKSPRRRTRHSSAAENVAKLPKLSPKISKAEAFDFPSTETTEEETPRRITRHAAAVEEKSKIYEKKHEPERKTVKARLPSTLSPRATPPPPLLLPTVIPSKITASPRASGRSTPVKHDAGLTQAETEVVMNELLSWRLVPEDALAELPTIPPSSIYGCQHLLRLFVKLPEFLGRMNIPDMKLRTLLRYFDNFLEYLNNRLPEFTSDNSYVNAAEAKLPGIR